MSAGKRTFRRRGFTLIEVALATVILTIGLLFCSQFFTNVYRQLSPQGEGGGIRRHIMAEQMLKANAEALRAERFVSPHYGKMLNVPPGSDYDLDVTGVPAASNASAELIVFEMHMKERGSQRTIGKLTMSTLRRKDGNDAKIGL